jgi:hypothetical protein
MESKLNFVLEKVLSWAEALLIPDYPFSAEKSELKFGERLAILWGFLLRRFAGPGAGRSYEISVLLYSQAGKRMLIPILLRILNRSDLAERRIRVNLVHTPRYAPLSQDILEQMKSLGCNVATNKFSLIEACIRPRGKVVLMCLDHRRFYEFHKTGVDAADTLRRFSVKTVSIQHGGSGEGAVSGLATSASDIVLVWGQRVFRELVQKHQVDQCRLRLVGNPLHDRILSLDREKIISRIEGRYPGFQKEASNKKIVVLATCLHTEYMDYENEEEMYVQFLRHIYESLDFSRVFLFVKMHPEDSSDPNLYAQLVPPHSAQSVRIVDRDLNPILQGIGDSAVTDLDVYSLLYIADLLITRASTVAEEAVLTGKKVIAFDLIESGPSRYYKHLEAYGYYRRVYASPESALREAISAALSTECNYRSDIAIADMTYLLDGKSTDRAAGEIIDQLLTSGDTKRSSLVV